MSRCVKTCRLTTETGSRYLPILLLDVSNYANRRVFVNSNEGFSSSFERLLKFSQQIFIIWSACVILVKNPLTVFEFVFCVKTTKCSQYDRYYSRRAARLGTASGSFFYLMEVTTHCRRCFSAGLVGRRETRETCDTGLM